MKSSANRNEEMDADCYYRGEGLPTSAKLGTSGKNVALLRTLEVGDLHLIGASPSSNLIATAGGAAEHLSMKVYR